MKPRPPMRPARRMSASFLACREYLLSASSVASPATASLVVLGRLLLCVPRSSLMYSIPCLLLHRVRKLPSPSRRSPSLASPSVATSQRFASPLHCTLRHFGRHELFSAYE